MSYEFEGEREYETEPARDIGALPSSRRTAIVIYIVLALTGSGAAFPLTPQCGWRAILVETHILG